MAQVDFDSADPMDSWEPERDAEPPMSTAQIERAERLVRQAMGDWGGMGAPYALHFGEVL
jgi:hypothetical protein